MPKKLTRTRVFAEYKKILKVINTLMMDKGLHPDSNVNVSIKKLVELHGEITRAFNRMK
jgi:hypothetical protein